MPTVVIAGEFEVCIKVSPGEFEKEGEMIGKEAAECSGIV
jgi:hypothetical protein